MILASKRFVAVFLFASLFFFYDCDLVQGRKRKRKRSVGEVKFDGETYSLDDPAADHRSEGIRRSEANDHTGAVESLRAAVKFEKFDKGGAHMNLALLECGWATTETRRQRSKFTLTPWKILKKRKVWVPL